MKQILVLLLFLGLAACVPPNSSRPADTQLPYPPTSTSVPPTATPLPRKDPPAVPTQAVLEESPIPTNLPPAALAAQKALAAKLKTETSAVAILSYEQVEWPDGCLGAAAPGEMCLQVITPGYLVNLKVQDRIYQVHTDQGGRSVRIIL